MAQGEKKVRPAVALLIETSNSYGRGLLAGIISYIRRHGPWSVHHSEASRGHDPPAWLRNWRGDGIIGRVETPRFAKAVWARGVPVVDVSSAHLLPDVPWIETDDDAIAHLACQHLLDRGFRQLAFCGEPGYNWSRWREEAFVAAASEAGVPCSVLPCEGRPRESWRQEHTRLAKWLRKLPRPLGVMASYDGRGRELLEVCRAEGIAVPEEVAVIGVDNDEILCELADPPLSSVVPDTHRTGYEAAAILDRLMAGEIVGRTEIRIPPVGIVARLSTDVLAIEDRDVAAAVRFIREHACEGIKVTDVLGVVSISRRAFESRFKKLVGRTPHQEILRQQLDRVKTLLRETDLPLETIAYRTGFRHPEYLSVAFKRELDLTPSEFREQAAIG